MVALVNFLLAASMGALLRLAFVAELPGIKYQYLLHAHSHVAMLGWLYMALFALLVHAFVPAGASLRRYSQLFWMTEVSVIGMLLSFPVQGYGPVSIAFSTIHILFSYVFIWWLWKDMGPQRTYSRLFLRTALFFQFFSTLGVWMMGPIMATALRESSFYYLAVQFYLHFQFNGWFIMAVLALLFKWLEKSGFTFPARQRRFFYYLLVSSCLLTYGLAVVWATHDTFVLLFNSIGGILQALAFLVFLRLLRPVFIQYAPKISGVVRILLLVSFVSFGLKIGMQALLAIPTMAEAAYTVRHYIIGFIHLVLLGTMTFFLLAFSVHERILGIRSALGRWGLGLLFIGFVFSELLLFLQGSMLWLRWGLLPAYYESLFGVSTLLPLGLLLLLMRMSCKIDRALHN